MLFSVSSQVELPHNWYILRHRADLRETNPLESGCRVRPMPESREMDQMEDLVESGYWNHLDHG